MSKVRRSGARASGQRPDASVQKTRNAGFAGLFLIQNDERRTDRCPVCRFR
jgi:hypothetical protein